MKHKIEFLKNNKKLLALILGSTIGVSMMSGCSKNGKTYEDIAGDLKDSGYSSSYNGLLNIYNDGEISKAVELTKEIIGDVGKPQLSFVNVYGFIYDEDFVSSIVEEGNDVGLIITPSDATYSSIYDSVDCVKDILSKYDINGPIFYNVSSLMDDDYIEANCKLGDAFCSKLAADGCYVGFYGSVDDLDKYSSAFIKYRGKSIDAYDKMTLIDYYKMNKIINDNINTSDLFKNLGNLIVLPDGTVLLKSNISKIIEDYSLNENTNFQKDVVYTVQSGDTFVSIAQKYGMVDGEQVRYDVLRDYNGYNDGDILHTGDHIVIPVTYDEKPIFKVIDSELTKGVYGKSSEVNTSDAIGIDVSDYQDKINWEETSKYIDYAFIKLKDFSAKLDKYYDYNMSECNRLGIPVGVYYFSRAITEEDAKVEVDEVIKFLDKYQIDLPVYIDLEDPDLKRLMKKKGYGAENFKKIIGVAFNALKNEGYRVGLYGNCDDMVNIIDDIDCEYWFTNSGDHYDDKINLQDKEKLEDKYEEAKYDFGYIHGSYICQHTCCGSVPGINGNVDVDHCPYDYFYSLTGKNDKNKVKVYS